MLASSLLEVVKSIPVWLSPRGQCCRMRVEGMKNASWLLEQMAAVAICPQGGMWSLRNGITFYSFELKCLGQHDSSDVERLLKGLPSVQLMSGRA